MVDPFAAAGAAAYDPFADDDGETMEARSSFLSMEDLEDRLLWILPTGTGERPSTLGDGDYSYLICDLVVLDGVITDTVEEVPMRVDGYEGLWGGVLMNQVKRALSHNLRNPERPTMLLGRLGKGRKAKGRNAPWLLSEPTDADKALRARYAAELRKQAAQRANDEGDARVPW